MHTLIRSFFNKISFPLLGSLIFTIFFTYPLLREMPNGIEKGDGILNTWIIAWDVHSVLTAPLKILDANIFYPAKHALLFSENLIGTLPFSLPIYLITKSPIITYNMLIFIGFFLSCFGGYCLALYFCQNRIISLLCGALFSFSTYKMTHFWWFQLTQAQYLPLAILFLHRFFQSRSLKDILLFSLFFCWQFLCCMYYGVFLSLVVIAICALSYLEDIRLLLSKEIILKLFLGLAVVLLILCPIFIPFYEVKKSYILNRSLADIVVGSANLLSYWNPSRQHKIWFALHNNLLSKELPWEKYLFLGFMPILAFVIFLYLALYRRFSNLRFAWFYLFLTLMAILISAGPKLYFGNVFLGNNLIYNCLEIFPGISEIRVPARFAIITTLGISIFTAIVAAETMKLSKYLKWMVPAVLGFLLVTDQLHAPLQVINKMKFNPDKIPSVYSWLSEQPGDFPIVEIPFAESVWRESEYMYYSMFHWKKLVNGYSGFMPSIYFEAEEIFAGFPNQKAIAWSKEHSVKYVIIHKEFYKKADFASIKKFEDKGLLKYVTKIGDDEVYSF